MPATPILGQIMPFAGSIIPRGWALCNGALLSIQQNTALFSLLGTYYGGNGVTVFGLPNLMGRAILGADSQGSYVPGMISGTTAVSLTTATLPSHPHGIQAKTDQGGGRGNVVPTGNTFATNTLPAANPTKIFAAAGQQETPLAIGTNVLNEGGGSPHNNMQPYLTISYLIALQGVYPSRD
ncbi:MULTISPECIES: phage tail protein [Bradyrhizobium]|uniref:phage tail protein n=1 Tax=Bradyrhizobium TaxID=374 RepID=UPI000231CEF0|nr:tail fiber protein [Bradyrhizobium japonicum]KMJ98817.1 tail protein [Bradyrhizobium japonicum]MBR0765711.1 tail fiber protein [Bradyrhizobium japonicum]MCS3540088.1 microcystin-dependent protein [Bradyrhizobium japonicum]MCS3992709.1 microcystin-dependent protein [Bradyrhizobium japonicum]MCS4208468.1 microcystin-dependent protein [Bradyrhizobium japonicum]